jgi:carbon monoxide dehydrogenase subunit G
MTDFISEIKIIPHNRQIVYDTLSNMENLAKLKDRIPGEQLRDFTFEGDACSFSVQPLGQMRVAVADREEPQTIRWTVEKAPVNATLQIELLPEKANETQVRLTVSADLNPFIKHLVSKPLQEGVNKIADALTILPYGAL